MAQLFNPGSDFAIFSAEELVKRFTHLDYIVFIAMITLSGALGLYGAFRGGPQNTIRQLLAADGQLPPILVSTSLMASFISASYILGNAAEIHRHGTMFLYSMVSYVFVIAVTAHLYLPLFYNSGALTVFEYLELRFDRFLRYTTVLFYFLQMTIYISIQLYAPALALSNVTGMSFWSAVFAIGIVCTIYTSVGGIKAVVYTDTFQAIWMIGAMMIVVTLGFIDQGGFAHAWEVAKRGGRIRFEDASFDPTVRHSVWGLVIGGFFTNLASYATNQMMVLRYFTVSTETRAKMVVWGNLPYLAIIFTLSCFSGLMTFAYFSDCDPVITKQIKNYDEILPYFVMVVLGERTALPGLFASGIFAASLSSISSAVNALANVIFVDVISPISPSISNETGANIITVLGVVCGMLSIVLVLAAEYMGNVLQATNAVISGIGGPVLGVLSVGAFLPFVNARGARLCFLVSLGISLWINLKSVIEPLPIHPQLPISVGSCQSTYMAVMKMGSFVEPVPQEWTQSESFSIYQISYVWYTAISVVIAFVVAIPACFVTGFNDPRKMDPKLAMRPFDSICWWLSKETLDRLAFHLGAEFEANDELRPGSGEGLCEMARGSTVLDEVSSASAFQAQDERLQGLWIRS